MANEIYVPIFFDWPEATKELKHQEKGRLIDAIVIYARGGDWSELLEGNERYLFPMFQLQVDRSRAEREATANANRENGKKGGRPKKPGGFSENPNNPTVFLETQKTHNKNNNNNKYKNENKDNNNHHDDDGAGADPLAMYAVNNLQSMSPGNLHDLAGFAEDLPADVIRFAIDEGCANGAPRWSYVAAILRGYLQNGIKTVGDAKAAKAKRKTKLDRSPQDNPALNFEQREYKPEDFGDDFFIDLDKYGEG